METIHYPKIIFAPNMKLRSEIKITEHKSRCYIYGVINHEYLFMLQLDPEGKSKIDKTEIEFSNQSVEFSTGIINLDDLLNFFNDIPENKEWRDEDGFITLVRRGYDTSDLNISTKSILKCEELVGGLVLSIPHLLNVKLPSIVNHNQVIVEKNGYIRDREFYYDNHNLIGTPELNQILKDMYIDDIIPKKIFNEVSTFLSSIMAIKKTDKGKRKRYQDAKYQYVSKSYPIYEE